MHPVIVVFAWAAGIGAVVGTFYATMSILGEATGCDFFTEMRDGVLREGACTCERHVNGWRRGCQGCHKRHN